MTTPPDLPSLVSEGRRLIAEATKGPWEVWGEDDLPDHDDLCIAAFDIVAPNAGEEPPSLYVCNVGSNGGTRSWLAPAEAEEKWPVSLANAKLIALALNSFPLLLAVAEAAGSLDFDGGLCGMDEPEYHYEFTKAEVERLRAALRGEVTYE